MQPRVTVVIPTITHPGRHALIHRCIDSVLEQADVDAVPLLVVNGSDTDFAKFDVPEGAVVVHHSPPDLPAAIRAGREAVETPFFTILDDDDYLLPGSLAVRIEELAALPDADVLVTNGYIDDGKARHLCAKTMSVFADDPLGSLKKRNWLSPGSALFRAERIPLALFDDIPRYLEWTFLALRLGRDYRIAFSDAETFVYSANTPGSISNSEAYVRGQPAALSRILRMRLRADVREHFEAELGSAWNRVALLELDRRRIGDAWKAHVASMRQRGGLRFLPFTRKLVGLP